MFLKCISILSFSPPMWPYGLQSMSGHLYEEILYIKCLFFRSVHPCDRTDMKVCQDICTKKGDEAVCSCKENFQLEEDASSCEEGTKHFSNSQTKYFWFFNLCRDKPLTNESCFWLIFWFPFELCLFYSVFNHLHKIISAWTS